MSSKRVLLETNEVVNSYDAAVALKSLADKIIQGGLGAEPDIEIPGKVELKIKAKEKDKPGKGKKTSIEIEIKWKEDVAEDCDNQE